MKAAWWLSGFSNTSLDISGNYCIIDINSDLYMVSMSDGLRVDSFYEDQLERAW